MTWTYTVADSAVEYLAAGQTKVETFTITLDDQHGGVITKQIDVTITGTNDAPVITAQDVTGAVTEQVTPAGNLTDSGTIAFTDVDLTDVHWFGHRHADRAVARHADGGQEHRHHRHRTGGQLTWTYTVADTAVEYLAAGQTKVETFTITLDDQRRPDHQADRRHHHRHQRCAGDHRAGSHRRGDRAGHPAGNLTDSGTSPSPMSTSPTCTGIGHRHPGRARPRHADGGRRDTDTTGTGAGGQLTWTYTVADTAVEYLAAGQTKVETFTITLDDHTAA